MGIIIPPPSAQCGDTHLTYRIEQPKRIRVGGIKHVTPQLVVQHATTRLTVPVPTHEALLLRSLCLKPAAVLS